ncbi:MAG: hypothetical protein KA403_02695 [Candidatus Omnitrophica bacterium]|nr:hypothetical protein [Candidatus Omnitrophota bacterium]
MKCIYCLTNKDRSGFTKKEHVIPQAFGVFNNNFTLNDIVCDSCNEHFGKTIDLTLARDSYEGLLRYDQKIKRPEEFKTIGKHSRLIMQMPDGPFKGTYGYPEYCPTEKRILLKPLPQVGFVKPNGAREFFRLDDIPDKAYLINNYNLEDQIAMMIFGCDPTIADKILADKGITFKDSSGAKLQIDVGSADQVIDVQCEVKSTIDQTILRAVAKIGFNYLAYLQKADFMLHKDFDLIRTYILTGETDIQDLVKIEQASILGDEPISGNRRVGHILTVDWAREGQSIIAQISLMNWLTYRVLLAWDFTGEHRNIRSGHFFNFPHKTIIPLISVNINHQNPPTYRL